MITITKKSQPSYNDFGVLECSGVIELSNGIDIWFSEIHPIKTYEEASVIANKIVESINKQ